MDNVTRDLKQAIESHHGGTAKFVKTSNVKEVSNGVTVWDGVVHVFDLAGHPTAKGAYAWSETAEGSSERTYYTVLHKHPVYSAQAAVKSSIGHRQHGQ